MKTLLLTFALVATLGSPLLAQTKMPDACSLLTMGDINITLGAKVRDTVSRTGGMYCDRRSDDSTQEMIVQYVDLHDKASCEMSVKTGYDTCARQLADGKKIVGVYTTFENFPTGGALASVMTAESDGLGNKNLIRLQFPLGQYLVTFDSRGIPIDKVKAKLPEIYKIIESHSGL
jgi:hypothetical protein